MGRKAKVNMRSEAYRSRTSTGEVFKALKLSSESFKSVTARLTKGTAACFVARTWKPLKRANLGVPNQKPTATCRILYSFIRETYQKESLQPRIVNGNTRKRRRLVKTRTEEAEKAHHRTRQWGPAFR